MSPRGLATGPIENRLKAVMGCAAAVAIAGVACGAAPFPHPRVAEEILAARGQADPAFAAGLAAADGGDWDQAIDRFTEALANNREEPAVLCNLGLAHAAAGHELAADAWLRAYLAAAPDAANAGEIRRRIDRLEDAVEGKAGKILDQAVSGTEKLVQLYGPHGSYYPKGYHPPVAFVNGSPLGGVPGILPYGSDLFFVLRAVARSGNVEGAVRLCETWHPMRDWGDPVAQGPESPDATDQVSAELWCAFGQSKAEAGRLGEATAALFHPTGVGRLPAWEESGSMVTVLDPVFHAALELGDWAWADSCVSYFKELGMAGDREDALSRARDSSREAIENDPRTPRQGIVDEWIELATELSADEGGLDPAAAVREAGGPSAATLGDFPRRLADVVETHITAGLNRIQRQARKAELLARALCAAAQEEIRAKDYPRALVACGCALALAPEDAHPYYYRAEAERGLGDQEGAMADLTKAIEISPDEAGFHTARAWLNEEKGNYNGAVADLRKGLELAPPGNYYKELLRNRLARVELKQGAYDAVVADCDAAIALHSADKARMQPAELGNGDDVFKEDHFFRLFVSAYRLRSDARFARGEWAGAMADRRRAMVDVFRDSGLMRSAGREAEDHFALAVAQCASGNDEGAIAEFDEAAAAIDDLGNEGDWPGFAILHRHVILDRLGRGDDGFAATVASWSEGGTLALPAYDWLRAVGMFLTGRLGEDALFAQAMAREPADESGQRRRMCTAFYFSGMTHLQAHDVAAARRSFVNCVAVGQRHFPEYGLGARELARLPPPTWSERLNGLFGGFMHWWNSRGGQ